MQSKNLKSFVFILCFFPISLFGQQLTQDQLRVRLDSFLSQHPSSQHDGMTTKDVKAMPKYDRPDLAAEQDFYMTIDPNTLTVPSQRKFQVMEWVAKYNSTHTGVAIPGVKWTERGPNNFGGRTRGLMFDPTDGSNSYKKVWAGGVAGGLWYNNDITSSSSTWTIVDNFWPNMAVTTIAFDPTDDSTFYVGTGEGWYNADGVRGQGIWKSEDAGQTWSQLSSTKTSSYYYIQKLVVTSTGRLIVATRSGLFYSDNGGTSFSSIASGVWGDVEIAANDDIYATKGNIFTAGEILKSTNNGTSFSSVNPSGAGTIRRVEIACAPSDSNTIYAVAQNTSYNVAWMKKSTNGGSSWSAMKIPKYLNDTTKDFTRGQAWYDLILGVHPTNSSIVIAGGIDLHKTTNAGSSWSAVSHWYGGFSRPEVHADQHAIQFRPGAPNEAIFGHDGGVNYSSNIGSSSSPTFAHRVKGYNVTQFYSIALENTSGSNYMLAGAQDNGSHKFTSAGIGATSEVTGGDGAFCFIDQDNSNYQITSYVRNNFYRSTNGGTSFSSISSNSSGRFINPCDYDDDADILYAAAGTNQIYRISGISGTVSRSTLTVGGSALGSAQASHVRCSPYSNHVLFVGTSSGGIFKVTSANGSATSTDIDPNNHLPAGYISCIEVGSSDNHLLVTYTNYGVTSIWETKNGGTAWTNKEGNLPDMPVRWALYNPQNRNQVMLATEVGVWTTTDISATNVDWDPSNNGLANVRCDMLQIRESDNLVGIATHARGAYTTNIFGDTTIKADFTVSTTEACTNHQVTFTSTSTGHVKHNKWKFTPNSVTYLKGTDSTSAIPVVSFNASGNYSVQLISSDSLKNDNDTVVKSNVISALSSTTFVEHEQNFDTITAISGNKVDQIWKLEYDADFPWAIDSNGTTSSSTGPSLDASGSGHYMYTEASTPAVSGDIAYASTGCLSLPDTAYFSFMYHMYGSTMGSLTLEADTGNGFKQLFYWNGPRHLQANASWTKQIIDLGKLNNATAILRFKAIRGSNYWSDIALDELRLLKEITECERFTPSVCNTTTINTSYDMGVHAIKIGSVEYTSSGVDVDGPYTDRVCTDTFTVADSNFTLNVKAGKTYANYVRAFIDFNDDGALDTINEMVWYSGTSIGYRSSKINLPRGAIKNDFLRMRIITDYSPIDKASCGGLDYGESEDFGLKIASSKCGTPSADLGSDTLVCGTSLTLNPGAFLTYDWSTGASTQSITVNTDGKYTVTLVDSNGCRETADINVTFKTPPVVDLGGDVTQCGGDIILDAGSFTSYLWSDASTADSLKVSKSGTYSVKVTDSNGCTDTDTVDVLIHALPTVNLGSDSTQCGGVVTLNAGSFASYLWNTTATSDTLIATSSGTYSVVVIDSNGCSATDSVDITINPIPVVNLGNDTVQCGGKITLTAGTFASYSWSNGASTKDIEVDKSGTFSLTAIDSKGCLNSDTVVVSIFTPPIVDLGKDSTQCGGKITLSAGSFSNYSWNTSATTSSIDVISSGHYSVTVTDANGCTDSDTVSITINDIPNVNLGNDTIQCGGEITLSGGTFSKYFWSTSATTKEITVTNSATYTLDVEDTKGCVNSDTINVTIHGLPVVSLGKDSAQCGGSITLDGGTWTSYKWNDGSTKQTVDASSSATYWLEITDANGCNARDSVDITIHTLPNVNLGLDTIACGVDVELDAGNFLAYRWSTSDNTRKITVTTSGDYSVMVRDANLCEGRDTISVTIHSLPVVNLGKDQVQCAGSITLDAGAFSSYSWNNGKTSRTIDVSTSGDYIVRVGDANGCFNEDTVNVTIHALPTLNLGNDIVQCGGSVTLNAGNFNAYKWSSGWQNKQLKVSSSGTYWVEVTDANGCKGRDSIDITIHKLPVVDLGKDTVQCSGDIRLDAGNFSGYLWSTTSNSQTIDVNSTGQYWVEVIDVNNCKDRDSVEVTIHTLPNVNLGGNQAQCGGSLTLNAGSFTHYVWSDASTQSTLIVDQSGDYWVEITDVNNCKDSDTVSITINPIPMPSLGVDTVQCDGEITLTPGAFDGYVWDNLSTQMNRTVSQSGEYFVEVSSIDGCFNSDTIRVTIYTTEINFLTDETVCELDSIHAGNGSQYNWSTGSSSEATEITQAGKVWVDKMDANGCPTSDTAQIGMIALPKSAFTSNNVAQDATTFGVDFVNNSDESLDYMWYFGDGDSSTAKDPRHTYQNGTYTASLVVTNECGTDTMTQEVRSTLSIRDLADGLTMYPNPSRGFIVLEGDNVLKGEVEITVTSAKGEIVVNQLSINPKNNEYEIDLSSCANGVYQVQIKNAGNTWFKEVVLIR